MEYQSIRGTVRPKLAYGITYYLPSSFLTSAMAGVNIFLTEHVALSVAYEAEFFSWQMPLIPASRGVRACRRACTWHSDEYFIQCDGRLVAMWCGKPFFHFFCFPANVFPIVSRCFSFSGQMFPQS